MTIALLNTVILTRVVASDAASIPCCGRKVSFLFLEFRRRHTINQPSINVEEVVPNFVMATLICFLDAQHAERDCEGSVRADLPFILGTRRFQEPTRIRPFTWHASWSPQKCGARRDR